MATFAQTDRLLTFTTPLGKDKLLPERMTGTEGISELFHYKLDLLATTDSSIDATQIVGKRVCVGILADDSGKQRYINGIVSSFEMLNVDEEFSAYRATIVPSLWILTLNKNTRCYQNKTVIDIIKAVLSPYSISPSVQTSNTYAPLEYCTQYRETDFAFISRLMEQHGILYYFQHTSTDHTLTLYDTSNKLSDCPIKSTFKFRPEPGDQEGRYDFVVDEITSRSTLVTGKYTAWDYSFVRYQTIMGTAMNTAGPLGANSNEDYDYAQATPYIKLDASDTNMKALEDAFTTVRRDVGDDGTLVVEGESNAICMQTGYSFTLSEHQQAALNAKYLIVHLELKVQQIPSYRSKTTDAPEPFTNRFIATPFSTPYRPPFRTEKPVVYGMHTGKVVVSSGEDSHLDKYGRVNVQFWWDRLRQSNTPDNTWLRVAQSWAGKGWGTYYWPRVDDEVLIGFMEGDPDQPIVVGSVYNGANMPKYDLPGHYTLSGILTRSSKGGGADNANELRFEDLKGSEQIYINAERDFDTHVENDMHLEVDKEQHITIKTNHFEEVDGDSHLLIKGKYYEEIDGDRHRTLKGKHTEEIDGDRHHNIKGKHVVQVGGDREHTVSGNLKESIGANSHISVTSNLNHQVGQNYSLTVGQNFAAQASMNFDVSAPMQISLSCGANSIFLSSEGIGLNGEGGFISITPAGITISGMLVNINSAGAPVMGAPGMAQPPQPPTPPDAPTAPTAPKWPGDNPYSQSQQAAAGQAGAAAQVTDSGGGSPAAPPSPAAAGGAAAGAAGQVAQAANQAEQQAQQAVNQLQQDAQAAANQASQAANQAAQQAQQAANQAQQAAKQAEQQAQQAVNQAMNEARGAYNQAQQAAQQAEQAANQAVGQAKAAAQQAAQQAQQAANQAAQQAAAAVQAAKQQAQQVEQQAQQTANQAQQAAQQAQQQAQQAANQAKQAAQQAVQQAQQQVQQAAKQGQQAVQQAQQQAQQAANQAKQAATQAASQATQAANQAANQAKQAAGQAQQQAQQAASQVQQAASGAQQQAQQAAQSAQQSAQQAMNSMPKGF
jgi:type VI secretion system secreted protein VgrG